MRTVRLAWTQFTRDLAAGEVRIMLAALVLAVLAVTAVGFVTDRAERALAIEANRLLGGDAVVRADQPIAGKLREAANAAELRRAEDWAARAAGDVRARIQLDPTGAGDRNPSQASRRMESAARTMSTPSSTAEKYSALPWP